ncbi:alanine--tRNA ligase [Solirubrobacter sp. CPCC 204708]|uniref:Alanine--tRNA ligase n=1 Tax=Solirubrobacter deserti TaxID=2282478 RepID=A0ABT4RHV0_9ACTN|nr:alanine--tRNA ligase [Solirubrobacter deserti]MBE2316580.1 alanine--tRNA ligase [Solirubrobacter deserti]MDA0138112.1 alanine--tRNA ligase [Solirubrobacter deserti]
MTSDEIRERYLSFFESRDHKRLPSASLVPAEHDPSVLLTTAGMHPLKPYFQGREQPPHHRLTSCQKCFRTPDIDQVGLTTRHLTCFEMLGNFSIGDYFKEGAAQFAWELSIEGFGFKPEDIWVTVFAGDEELGLGPDQEAIDVWLKIGVPRERIVLLGRDDNFWQAGPTGPCGPCSELYLDRGLDFGEEDDLPGGDNERFLEYWNLVFMQYEQNPVGTLTPLPAPSIDTGLGLNRMALIQQGVTSIFETDQFTPLIALGEELSGKRYESDPVVDRALRVLADHTRGMSFLIADGVVPDNADRGYVLRRLMRRAIVQGRRIGIEPGFLPKYAQVVRETMGKAYPELIEHADTVDMWLASEEESFNRTLEQGMRMLEDVIEQTKADGAEGIGAEAAFRLHDTYGFPFDLTVELAGERGVGVDAQGFERLMDAQREKSRAVENEDDGVDTREQLRRFASEAGAPSKFTGYETTEQATAVASVVRENGRVLAKLVESPFYATGGGQVHDDGVIECEDGGCSARVVDVVRLGDDQALVLEPLTGELKDGERVWARVDRSARRATECNHTATHLLHAALRERLGSHVHQAGSYVGPDKLRFDFTHGTALSAEDRAWVEDRVNAQILENSPVRAITTTLDEAKALGAMALFGEKYGDVVRMVSVGDGGFSRELCGGTHVRSTAEIGVFKITQETSSSANVRRIEAITGPAGVELLRRHDRELAAAAVALRTSPDAVAEAAATAVAKRREAEKALEKGAAADTSVGEIVEIGGVKAVFEIREVPNPKALPDLADKLRGQLGDPAVVVLGAPGEGRASLLVSATPGAVAAGVKAGAVVKVAAAVVGGGGGGRDNMAQAGGKDPSKLPDALVAARAEIERALAGSGA